MNYSWTLFFTTALVIFGILVNVSPTSYFNMFAMAGLALLSAIFADMFVKLLVNILPRKTLPDLRDKAVLVTGCDTGFGNLCAKRLDAMGVTVFAGCLFPEGPGATELKVSASSNLHIVTLDVTNEQHVQDAVKYVEESLGGRDLWAVINNAGIGALGEVDWSPMEILRQVMEVNMFGVVQVTKAFLPTIRKSKGRIVCVSSIAAHITVWELTYYSMSKAAVRAFTDGLRREMSKWSVSVHGIEPNVYSTDITSARNVDNMAMESWRICPEHIRSAYGSEYFESAKKCLKGTRWYFVSHRLQDVVDDMVDASVGLTPKIRYVPGFLQQFVPWICMLLPTEILDFLHNYLLQPTKKPAALT